MTDLIIRKATEDDIDQLVELENLCFTTPWSRESLIHDVTKNAISTYIVAELEEKIVGYVGVWAVIDEVHINNVAVSPLYRRQHIGTVLIDTMIKATEAAGLKSHTLEVRIGNRAAIALYESFNFQLSGRRKGYYTDNGEDAIIMWREEENK